MECEHEHVDAPDDGDDVEDGQRDAFEGRRAAIVRVRPGLTFVTVRVVKVRRMRMRVHERDVPVAMGVRVGHRSLVRVCVVFVVRMLVFVDELLVHVRMRVVFGDVQQSLLSLVIRMACRALLHFMRDLPSLMGSDKLRPHHQPLANVSSPRR